jgi:hypothetical protein
MTKELQHAMAEYEEARIRYRQAVLASLNGASNGEAIRSAIHAFQNARAELGRAGGTPIAAQPQRAAAPEQRSASPWGFVRRLMHAV